MSGHVPELFGAALSARGGGPRHEAGTSLVSLSDITEIELTILRRMRELTMGDHRSLTHGSGFDFVGLRDWQAGDRPSQIDWPQSTLSNFTRLVVREFEQPSTASVVVVADGSRSTRCGVHGQPIAAAIARAIAIIGMSAVFFQDMFGLITFEDSLDRLSAIQPRIGRNQVMLCLDAYERQRGMQDLRHTDNLSTTIASFMRRTALVPFVSDFLVPDPDAVLNELAQLNTSHDVMVLLIDAAFAFEFPSTSAGWIDTVDVETGRTRVLSRAALARMADRVRDWQGDVEKAARNRDLDIVRIGIDQVQTDLALAEFVAERRLRKVS